MREIIFQKEALVEYNEWKKEYKNIGQRIKRIIEETQLTPFKGIGKPEPLKHHLSGCWSRRITKADRLVYQVTADSIIIVSCKYHY